MSECADFTDKTTKNCSVILKRLDETLLNEYVQKYGLRVNVSSLGSTPKLNWDNFKANRGPLQKYKHLEKPVKKNEFTRRKRKTKPLSYTDDEAGPNEIANEIFSGSTHRAGRGEATERPLLSLKDIKSSKSNVREGKCNKSNKTYGNTEGGAIKTKEAISKDEEKNNGIPLKNILYDSCSKRNNNSAFALSIAGSEVEIIEEFSSCSRASGNINCDATVKNYKERDNCVNSESGRRKQLEEYDLREDSEDDKNTVIFEEEFHKDTNADALEINENEMERSGRKLTNKDITNRKKPRLIKFKRKNMGGRNSGTVRKSETKLLETCTVGKKATDGEVPLKGVIEDSLKEVCHLVKRLHELHKIILQQKTLFKELPNRDELFVHFSKVINAQQENFQKEIKKNQKTIIRCYESMLCYQKPSEVALEISKRTFLNVDEVVYVLSQCFLVEGAGGVEKSKNDAIEKNAFQAQKSIINLNEPQQINSKHLIKTATRIEKTNWSMTSSHGYLSSEKNTELVQKQINEQNKFPMREISENNSLRSSREHFVKGYFPPKEGMQQKGANEMFTPYWIPKNCEQKPHSLLTVKDSRIEQSQNGLTPDLSSFKMHHFNSNKIQGLAFPNQSHGLSSNCPVNVGLSHGSKVLVAAAPFPSMRPREFPANVQILNHIPEKLLGNRHTQGSCYISSGSSTVPNVPTCVGNIGRFNKGTPHNNLTGGVCPSRIHIESTSSKRQVETFPNEARCSLEDIFTDSVKQNSLPRGLLISPHERTKKHPDSHSMKIVLGDAPLVLEEKTLDPTVPLKLTMRNYRLQAEPIISLPTWRETSEENGDLSIYQSSKEEITDLYKIPVCDEKDSKTRVYICALNDCNKLGTRICKGCQSVIYCSETCQLKHWTQKHKSECYQLKELRQ